MDFSENPDHRVIREAVREICARFPDEYWAELDQSHTFPWEFYQAMAKGGWIGVAIPAGFGGGGGGITEASIVLEEVAASGACMNGASSIHLSIFGMHPVVRHGSDELKRKYLPRVATGELHVAFGVTEPDAGLDTTAIRTRAVRDGEGYRVTGRKVWTSKARPRCPANRRAHQGRAPRVDRPRRFTCSAGPARRRLRAPRSRRR